MTGDGGMDWLKQEVKIPETVQNKADEALARIREQAEKKEGAQTAKRMRRRSSRGKSIAAAILAAFLIVGPATAAVGGYMARMSAGLKDSLHISDEQERELMEQGDLVQNLQETEQQEQTETNEDEQNIVSVTRQGVTIRAEQTVVDRNFVQVAFLIEGLECEEGASPDVGKYDFSIEGARIKSMGGHFYTDSEIEAATGSSTDGMLEFVMELQVENQDAENPSLIGRRITVSFSDLGQSIGNKADGYDRQVLAEGTWELSWILDGSDDVRIVELEAELEGTGATVKRVELSPLSIVIDYGFPRTEEEAVAYDEEGATHIAHVLAEPPTFTGMIMKDGTVHVGMGGMGSEGYRGDNAVYTVVRSLSQVIDPAEVESLLFIRSDGSREPGQELTLEDMFVVPLE